MAGLVVLHSYGEVNNKSTEVIGLYYTGLGVC